MRATNLNMLTERKQHPFDLIDMAFGLTAAITANPIAITAAIGQYFTRRSSTMCNAILQAMDLLPTVEQARAVQVLLPGSIKVLPAPQKGQLSAATKTADDLIVDLIGNPKSTPSVVDKPAPTNAHLSTQEWREALNESPHLLIYGPSKAGKSTLAQAIVAMFGQCDYFVIDPLPNKPGETKWGGVDFVTLAEQGADEYALIKTALDAIQAEDDRRRRSMRTHTHKPLIVVIDEVLMLVGALGTLTNEEGRKEPRMSYFLRRMGVSARHRNIKIVLIGQGKNLNDLGLNSGTARNNYALVRASRNPATNERSAYIVTDDGEAPIELQHVPKLAAAVAQHAILWRSHSQLESQSVSRQRDSDLLASLLDGTFDGTPSQQVPANRNHVPSAVPASGCQVPDGPAVPVTATEVAKIASLLVGNSPSKVIKMLDGYHPRKYDVYKAKVDAVVVMLARSQTREKCEQPSCPDDPDPDEDVPPAFRGALE